VRRDDVGDDFAFLFNSTACFFRRTFFLSYLSFQRSERSDWLFDISFSVATFPFAMAASKLISSIQSVGHGGMHKPHPEHIELRTECILFGAPTMASIGHADIQRAQPIQNSSFITAVVSGSDFLMSTAISSNGRCMSIASFSITLFPPGAHLFIFSDWRAMATAYDWQSL
jgi:hypothetical protein